MIITKEKIGFLIALLAAMILTGCVGAEIGRIPFRTLDRSGNVYEYAGQIVIDHEGGDIELWTDLNIEYFGDVVPSYKIDFLQAGQVVAKVQCNSLDVDTKVMSSEYTSGGFSRQRYRGRMRCAASLPAGQTTIRAILQIGPTVITMEKADLVIRKPGSIGLTFNEILLIPVFIVGFPIVFVTLWGFISFSLAFLGGWSRLAAHYRCLMTFEGQKWHRQSGFFGPASYNRVLTVGGNHQGLYLAVMLPFRLGHPPLLIPWQDITTTSGKRLFLFDYVEFRFARVPEVRFQLGQRTAQRVMSARN